MRAVGARAEAAASRGAARWCARASSPALFFVGVGGRGRDVGRRTLVAFGEPVRQAKVLRLTSYVLKGDEDKGQRTKDKGFRTSDIGTENRKTIEKHLALWRFIAVNCIDSDRPSFVL